jgi:hypothetical protein
MDKYYYLCEFNYGGSGQFYQEIQNGNVLRLIDFNGIELVTEGEYGYIITNTEPLINLF